MLADGLSANLNQKAKYIIGRPALVMHKCLSGLCKEIMSIFIVEDWSLLKRLINCKSKRNY